MSDFNSITSGFAIREDNTMASVGDIDKRDTLINAIRDLLETAESWNHNITTRRIWGLVAIYDGKSKEHRERMEQERQRALGIIERKQHDLDQWRANVNRRYFEAAAALPGDADADCRDGSRCRDGVQQVPSV